MVGSSSLRIGKECHDREGKLLRIEKRSKDIVRLIRIFHEALSDARRCNLTRLHGKLLYVKDGYLTCHFTKVYMKITIIEDNY